MRIYKLTITNDFAFLVEENEHLIRMHRQLFKSGAVSNERLSLKIADNDNSPVGDYAEVYIPVFSKKALDCLYQLIASEVHIIEWSLGQTAMYGIQILDTSDCIDWKNSTYQKITPSITVFTRYSFYKNMILNKHIFKIANNPFIYVSQEFVDLVHKNDLKNFGFELIFDSNDMPQEISS